MNRTRALAWLAAMRAASAALRSSRDGPPHSGGGPAEQDAVHELASIAAALARAGATGADAIEGALRRTAGGDEGPLQLARAAAARLTDAELRETALLITALPRSSRVVTIDSSAIGVMLLVRPLIDLRATELAVRSGLDLPALRSLLGGTAAHAASDADDAVVRVLGSGCDATTVEPWEGGAAAAFADALRTQAQRLRVEVPAADEAPAVTVFNVAHAQLVRWLRGFERSTPAFTTAHLLHRQGRLALESSGDVVVHWPVSGFDVVLQRAGCFEPQPGVPWWTAGGIQWQT